MWVVAPRTAVGAAEGDIEINVSGESDMSSVLPLDETAHERLASTRTTARETVPVTTVEAAVREHAGTAARVFVKSDTQGYEAEVLDGIGDAGTGSPDCSWSCRCRRSTKTSRTTCRSWPASPREDSGRT